MTAVFHPQADLLVRFEAFIGRVRQAIVSRLERGGEREGLGPLGLVLWSYLGRTLRRLAVLQTHVRAGTLRPPRTRTRSTSDRKRDAGTKFRLPCGPMLLPFHAAHLAPVLAALIDDPDTQALLAAAPQAGRLLRPFWRRLSPDRLPPCLRLPARQRAAAPSKGAPPADPAPPASGQRRRHRPGHRARRGMPHWAPPGWLPSG